MHSKEKRDVSVAPASMETEPVVSPAPNALEKRFNFLTLFTVYVVSGAGWETTVALLYQGLTGGGPVMIVWGYVACGVGAMCMAATLGEFASMWPSIGGQYHWAVELAPVRWKRIIGWAMAWLIGFQYVLGAVATSILTALQIVAAISIGVPTYVSERWHTYLIFVGLVLISAVINLVFPRWVHYCSVTGFSVHLLGLIATIITLLATGKPYNSAKYVFTEFQDLTGYNNPGVAILVGILPVAGGFCSITFPVHFAEETKKPRLDCPRAMFWGIFFAMLQGIIFNIILLFCMGDPFTMLANPLALSTPFAALILQTTGSNAAAICFSIILLMVSASFAVECMAVASRVLVAQGRDSALPYASILAKLSRWNTPKHALLVLVIIQLAVGTIYIGNATAYSGITSSYAVLLVLSFLIPTGLHLLNMHKLKLNYGPWKMPDQIRLLVNVVAFAVFGFIFVAMLIPTISPQTPETFNYAPALVGAVLIITTTVWFLWGNRNYTGPVAEIASITGLAKAPVGAEGDSMTV